MGIPCITIDAVMSASAIDIGSPPERKKPDIEPVKHLFYFNMFIDDIFFFHKINY